MDHFEGEHFTGLARWLTVPNSTITLWMCPKLQIDGQNHKNTGIRRKIFHKRPSRRADLGTLRMDDHWPVRNVFYERLRCWHLAWDSKLLSWQFYNTSIFWNKKNPTGCFCDLYPLKSMRKSFSVRTDIPQKVPIVFKKRAGDLFMFEIKKECTNFLRNVQKGLKIVQNLDTRLLCFLRQKCAYFAIFGTQLHIYCDF